MRRFVAFVALGTWILVGIAGEANAQARARISAKDQRMIPANTSTGGATPIPGSSFVKSNVIPGTARLQNNVVPGSKTVSPNNSLAGIGNRGLVNQSTIFRAPKDGIQRGQKTGKVQIPHQIQMNRQRAMMNRGGGRR